MKVWAPCRVGGKFEARRLCTDVYRELTVTGMGFFAWNRPTEDNMILYAKRNPENELEHTCFIDRTQLRGAPAIEFEIPVELIKPGCSLRRLGMDSDAVGRLAGLTWHPENGAVFYISRGNHYGSPLETVKTALLLELFAPVLPAVSVNVMDFLT